MTIRVAVAALSRRAYAGRPNKAGTAFVGKRYDVTSDVLKAVIEHIGDNQSATVEVDGLPTYKITVKRLRAPP